jgi:extensin-like protein
MPLGSHRRSQTQLVFETIKRRRGCVLKFGLWLAIIVVVLVECTAGRTVPLPRPSPERPSSDATVEPRGTPGGAPTACRLRLTPDRAVFEALGTVAGAGQCGGPDIVLLKRVLAADRLSVEITPPATLRCEMAEAVVDWVRDDLVNQVTELGSILARIENLDSFDCRGQNGVAGAKLSEHGRANAIDIGAIRFKSGQLLRPADAAANKSFRIAMRKSVCERFTTVLGPGSDGYHEDHIHIDLAERRSGYRICQWDIRDLMSGPNSDERPASADIPLPQPRPVAAGDTRTNPNPAKKPP